MVKLENINVNENTKFYMPEDWHQLMLNKLNKTKEIPYLYKYHEDLKLNNLKCFKFKSSERKQFEIILPEYILKYLNSTTVNDNNIGLSFKEYLPIENTDLLITNIRNPNVVVPGKFKTVIKEIEIDSIAYPFIDFNIDYLNGNGFTTLNYYYTYNKATWKFLYNEDTEYMTDYEKLFQDTYIHKDFVRKSCKKLATYLESIGAKNHAKMLMKRAEVHDNSKISCEDELRALSMIINDKESLKDATKSLSQLKQDAIKLHWKHNSHHPEYFENVEDMEKIDIMEMCCDWHARSLQYNTNLMDFVKTRQESRFHFPEYIYNEIIYYCKILIK